MIRRIVTLATVGVLVWLLLRIADVGTVTSAAESTFMLGFVLLAAALLGEIVEQIHLPRITGYIVAGVVFGPHAAEFVSGATLESLDIFNQMAYAFIGLAAGAELKLATLRGRWKSIVLLIVCTASVVAIGVGGFFFVSVSRLGFLGDLLPIQILAVAGMVGVIAAARSPSSAIAIIDETRADGPFTATILGVSVAMDVVVICLFSVAISLCGLVLAPELGMDLRFVLTLFGEIAASITLGVILGAIMGLYLKHEGPQTSLVIAGVCFLVYRFSGITDRVLAESHQIDIHMNPLLICAAAGFLIQNASTHGPRLQQAMDRVALPVYVAFFALAGARLDLGALATSWGIALAVAGFRIVMIAVGTRLATTLAGDPANYRRYSWMGFVTQAGLSLALIAQIEDTFAGWGAWLATTLASVVAINQLIGPAAFKIALEKVGEVRRRRRNWRRTA
jgi:Kef-type K+ transport system membrane component KefB